MARNWMVTKDQFLSHDEVKRLYSALKDARDLALQRKAFYNHVREYYIFRVFLETGVRVFELVNLRCSDFRSGALIIRHGKGNKKRQVLLAKGTQKMLAEFMRIKAKQLREPVGDDDPLFLSERRKPYSTGGIRKRVKLWFAKVGVSPALSCHACRHTFASHLIAAGVDLPTVRDNLGHSSLAVTSIYSHSTKNDLGDVELYN